MDLTFNGKRILVVGDLILDKYAEGVVQRISPEAPVPIVELQKEVHKPGGAANVAVLLRYLGAEVCISGVIGDDSDGELLISLLREEGIDTSFIVKEKERPTTVKTRVISRSQHIVRLDREYTSFISKETEQEVLSKFKEDVGEVQAILIEDYDKGFITPTIVRYLKTLGLPLYVDPKIRNIPYYTNIRLLKPNFREFKEAVGFRTILDKDDLYERAYEFKIAQNVELLLITMGEQGMLMIKENNIIHIPAIKREVYDVTGAGDMVIAAFVMSELSGYNPVDSAIIASAAAGIEITKLGATPVYPKEIEDVMHEEYDVLKKRVKWVSY